MRINFYYWLIFIFIFATGSDVFGQIKRGHKEVNIAGSLSSTTDGKETSTVIQLATGVGYFLHTNFEIGANLSFTKVENIQPFGTASGFLSIYPSFKIGSNTVPYVGGQIGIGYGPGDNSIIFGGFSGVKVFVSGSGGAISIQPFYLRQEYKNAGVHNFGILIGVSIFF